MEICVQHMKYRMTRINGCKSKEERDLRKGVPASYSVFEDTVSEKDGEPVGLACKLFADVWYRKCMAVRGENDMPDAKVNQFMQTTRKDPSTKRSVPLDKAIIRIKLKEARDKDGKLSGLFENDFVVIKDGMRMTRTEDGQQFNVNNIHLYLKSGSLAWGTIDFSETTTSGQGYSNKSGNACMFIKPSNRRGPSLDDEFNEDDLADMMGAKVDMDDTQDGLDYDVSETGDNLDKYVNDDE